ncbi:hypothetical protein M3Y99_00281400 [Aphelenchoides fujianensis]|nr:hypothetical protein M3Y99_01421300 [Aphelenchoides fujianensis]KAI6242044.1 hypothetical protein M3Y99_00281400 [Aphelenchoides fujianensis]
MAPEWKEDDTKSLASRASKCKRRDQMRRFPAAFVNGRRGAHSRAYAHQTRRQRPQRRFHGRGCRCGRENVYPPTVAEDVRWKMMPDFYDHDFSVYAPKLEGWTPPTEPLPTPKARSLCSDYEEIPDDDSSLYSAPGDLQANEHRTQRQEDKEIAKSMEQLQLEVEAKEEADEPKLVPASAPVEEPPLTPAAIEQPVVFSATAPAVAPVEQPKEKAEEEPEEKVEKKKDEVPADPKQHAGEPLLMTTTTEPEERAADRLERLFRDVEIAGKSGTMEIVDLEELIAKHGLQDVLDTREFGGVFSRFRPDVKATVRGSSVDFAASGKPPVSPPQVLDAHRIPSKQPLAPEMRIEGFITGIKEEGTLYVALIERQQKCERMRADLSCYARIQWPELESGEATNLESVHLGDLCLWLDCSARTFHRAHVHRVTERRRLALGGALQDIRELFVELLDVGGLQRVDAADLFALPPAFRSEAPLCLWLRCCDREPGVVDKQKWNAMFPSVQAAIDGRLLCEFVIQAVIPWPNGFQVFAGSWSTVGGAKAAGVEDPRQ